MSNIQSSHGGRKLPGPAVDKRYGICSRTRARWKNDPKLNFPKPAMTVNGREYYDEDQLSEWDRANTGRRAAQS